MEICMTCGNLYDKPLRILKDGRTFVFDCFECAIHLLAPVCLQCDQTIIGHGVEVNQQIFCSGHCARKFGETGIRDRIDNPSAAGADDTDESAQVMTGA